MIIDARGCWDAAKVRHKAFFDVTVNANLAANRSKLTVAVHKFLIANHDCIRDGQEADFRHIQAEFRKTLNPLSDKTKLRIHRVIKTIYNYETFAKKHPINWCAYGLCESLSILTCPYCNLSYGHTLKVGSDGVVRPTLDHFFDKATYPLFAISLGNLIASCYHCNSSLKGKKNFFTMRHLNPLDSSEKVKITLDVDLAKARYDLRLFDQANIRLDFDAADVQASNSVKTFYLQERYQLLIDEARFIAKNMQIYSTFSAPDPARLEWLRRGVSEKNYRNRVLGKLIKDFSDTYLPP
jgi:hypothetical protein